MEISKETDKEHMDANDEAQIDELRFSSDEESVSDSLNVDVPFSHTS